VTVRAYRITKAKHAATAFDGEGARLYCGRWNSPGVRIVYASTSLSLAVLEILVHLQSDSVLPDYVSFTVEFPDSLIELVDRKVLPADWRSFPSPPKLREIGDTWIRQNSSVALRVPSAILTSEDNVLLNPTHRDFAKLKIAGPNALDIDTRVFRR
jgi:RES domain-containing protein